MPEDELIKAMLDYAKQLKFGKLRVEITTEFELDVRDSTIQNWQVKELPRMVLKDFTSNSK